MITSEIILPHAPGPEKSVISSMLQDQAMIARAKAEGLTDEHFHLPAHARLFKILTERHAANQTIDLVTLIADAADSGDIGLLGGPSGITEIFTYAAGPGYFQPHVEMLRSYLARRRAIQGAQAVIDAAEGGGGEDVATALRAATDSTVEALQASRCVLSAKEAVGKLCSTMQRAAAGETPGLSTGLNPVDLVTGGMRPGELWVVAAEPSGGKSVVLLQATASAIFSGKRALVISLEMDAGIVIARLASCARSIPFATFTDPVRAKKHWLQVANETLKSLSETPLSIHDTGGLTFDRIAGLARNEAEIHGGLDLLVVDYLQLIEGSRQRRESTREQEVASVSRGLKALAKTLGCPVLTASQLNDHGRLRESRAIGQDADVVLSIESENIHGLKVRNGVRGQRFPLVLNGEFQRFEQVES